MVARVEGLLDAEQSCQCQAHLESCANFEQLLSGARSVERELDELRERMGARERDLDLLEFELNEIDSAAPSESEEVDLEAELKRLAAVETLMQAGWSAANALDRGSRK